MFKKDRDLKIGYNRIDLMKQRDEIENFNKKIFIFLIREMTDVETSYITICCKYIEKHYKNT